MTNCSHCRHCNKWQDACDINAKFFSAWDALTANLDPTELATVEPFVIDCPEFDDAFDLTEPPDQGVDPIPF